MPWLLLAALLLALADTLIGLQLRGLLFRPAAPRPPLRRRSAGCCWSSAAGRPALGADDEAIIAATAETRLAYVLTGLDEVDELSRAGLEGLSLVLNRRTAVEAGEPLGGRSRGRRPEPLSAALLADPERPSRAGRGRAPSGSTPICARRHDPVRYRRCRAR